MTKTSNKKVTNGNFLYVSIAIMLFLAMFLEIYTSSSLGNMEMDIEKLNNQISSQEKKNESLSMKISELTAYENIKGVVDEMGLSYNYENIIIIGK